jgi:class 3 adenylate cyclase
MNSIFAKTKGNGVTTRGMRIPLSWRILGSTSGLLVALISAMLVYVSIQAGKFVNERIASDLDQAREKVEAADNGRLETLQLTARLVASFPQLKALLSTDFATVRDFLLSYQQQNRRAELLIVLDPDGRVIARTDTPEPIQVQDAVARWVKPSLTGQGATGVLIATSGIYEAAASPAEAGGTVFGFVLAGSSIDEGYARQLRDVSQQEIIIFGERILGSTLAARNIPWQTRSAWEAAAGTAGGQRTITMAGETYAAETVLLGPEGGPRPLVVLLKSRDQGLAPYRRIQFGLIIIGFIAAIAGVAGSAVLARTVTAPVSQLVDGTKAVASGDFDFRLNIPRNDEMGDLAQSFNTMIQGLRERADMQKFVSRSTTEMIQARLDRDISSGERERLTIFFSDMRNFTSLSERRSPEEVVKILNNCFTLQAEKVKKFGGDIDKFVGDAVMALFLGEDMALKAIRCAVEIQKAIDAFNAEHPGQDPLEVGIGIATGDVVLGAIGSQDRLDFTVVGSHVNLSSRLCSLAGAREILLSESTYALVSDLIAAQPLEPVSVKGFSEPVSIYKMVVNSTKPS